MHRFDINASLERIRDADNAIAHQQGVLANAIGDDAIRAQRNLEALKTYATFSAKLTRC